MRPLTAGDRGDREDRGSLTLELAVLAPGLLLVLALLVVGGRTAVAGNAVELAAADAARSASLARTSAQAQTQADAAAATTLAARGLRCDQSSVQVDAAGFTVPVGQPAAVTVHVTCTAALGDLALPGLVGSKTLRASVTSPLDTYRER